MPSLFKNFFTNYNHNKRNILLKLTKSKLKQLIMEELAQLNEKTTPTYGQGEASSAIMDAWRKEWKAKGYAPAALEIAGKDKTGRPIVRPKKGAFKKGASTGAVHAAAEPVGTDGKPLLTLSAIKKLRKTDPKAFLKQWKRVKGASGYNKTLWDKREKGSQQRRGTAPETRQERRP